MLTRRRPLLDPAGADGNGPAPTQTPPPAAPPAPAPATPPANPDANALAELQRARARLAELEAGERQRAEAARQQTEDRLVKNGQAEEVRAHYQREIEAQNQRYRDLEERARNSERGRALASAFASVRFSYAEAPADLQRLWADDFEVVDGAGGGFDVRCKTSLRPVGQVVAERLASARYSAYLAAGTKGGGGASGGQYPAPSGGAHDQPQYASNSDRLIAEFNAQRQRQAEGPAWARSWRDTIKPLPGRN